MAKKFYSRYIKLPLPNETPPEIRDNPKLYPLFKGCLGSLDGTHIDAFVPDDALARYRNRKGGISQNVLAACTFDMKFCYILSGWEGSATDGGVSLKMLVEKTLQFQMAHTIWLMLGS